MALLIPMKIQDNKHNKGRVFVKNFISDKYLNIRILLKEVLELFQEINVQKPELNKLYLETNTKKWIETILTKYYWKYLTYSLEEDEEIKFEPLTLNAKQMGITFDLTRQVVYFNIWTELEADDEIYNTKNTKQFIYDTTDLTIPFEHFENFINYLLNFIYPEETNNENTTVVIKVGDKEYIYW